MSEDLLDKLGSRALSVEQARLARFFQTINKHRKALDMAIDENFDCTHNWLRRHGMELR